MKPAAGRSKPLKTMAGATGLEPAASGVTGRRSNQLSYAPAKGHPFQGRFMYSRDPPLSRKRAAAFPSLTRGRFMWS